MWGKFIDEWAFPLLCLILAVLLMALGIWGLTTG